MDQEAILRDYKELRRASIPLNTRLGKLLNGDEVGAAASALGRLNGKAIELDTYDEIGVVMDFAIHTVLRDGRNAVERMLQDDPPPEGSLELRLLQSMRQSHFTVFEVFTRIPGFGIRGLDGPRREPTVIVDLGFSQTADPGMALAARIHSPGEGWWMTTGAALPVNQKAIERIILDYEDDERSGGGTPSDAERARLVLRACLAAGASHQIRYATAGASVLPPAASRALRATPKIGRNDPCPCGSGMKYKRCCGN